MGSSRSSKAIHWGFGGALALLSALALVASLACKPGAITQAPEASAPEAGVAYVERVGAVTPFAYPIGCTGDLLCSVTDAGSTTVNSISGNSPISFINDAGTASYSFNSAWQGAATGGSEKIQAWVARLQTTSTALTSFFSYTLPINHTVFIRALYSVNNSTTHADGNGGEILFSGINNAGTIGVNSLNLDGVFTARSGGTNQLAATPISVSTNNVAISCNVAAANANTLNWGFYIVTIEM